MYMNKNKVTIGHAGEPRKLIFMYKNKNKI